LPLMMMDWSSFRVMTSMSPYFPGKTG
jgi:hypothetical protein